MSLGNRRLDIVCGDRRRPNHPYERRGGAAKHRQQEATAHDLDLPANDRPSLFIRQRAVGGRLQVHCEAKDTDLDRQVVDQFLSGGRRPRDRRPDAHCSRQSERASHQ